MQTKDVPVRSRPANLPKALKAFSQVCVASYGTLAVIKEPMDWTLEHVEEVAGVLGDASLLRMQANVVLLAPFQRTEFQVAFRKVYKALVKIRAAQNTNMTQTMEVAKALPVALWCHFQNLDHICRRHCERSNRYVEITLAEYMRTSKYHMAHSLVLLGSNETPDSGKANSCFDL